MATTPTHSDNGVLSPLLVDARGAGRLLSLSRATVFAMNSAGKIPRPLRPGIKDPRWSVAELRAWIEGGCPTREQWETRKAAAR